MPKLNIKQLCKEADASVDPLVLEFASGKTIVLKSLSVGFFANQLNLSEDNVFKNTVEFIIHALPEKEQGWVREELMALPMQVVVNIADAIMDTFGLYPAGAEGDSSDGVEGKSVESAVR